MNHTFAYDVSFSRDSSDVFYPDSSELAKILMAVIVVLFTSAVSLRYFVGEGTKAYGKSLLTVTMVTMLCVQYYQLWFAVLTLPVDFLSSAYRWDCLRSDKGGKVSGNFSPFPALISHIRTQQADILLLLPPFTHR